MNDVQVFTFWKSQPEVGRKDHSLVLSSPGGNDGFAFLVASGLCSSLGFWSSGLRNRLGGDFGIFSYKTYLKHIE